MNTDNCTIQIDVYQLKHIFLFIYSFIYLFISRRIHIWLKCQSTMRPLKMQHAYAYQNTKINL